MNQAWKLTAITLSRVRYQQSKTISLGLGKTIENVDENITQLPFITQSEEVLFRGSTQTS